MQFSIKNTMNPGFESEEYFFKENEQLVWYTKVHHVWKVEDVAYVIDTISGRAFRTLSPKYRQLFLENGFIDDGFVDGLRSVWMRGLELILQDIFRRKEKVRVVVVGTKESSRDRLEQSIFHYFKDLPDYIESLWWWGDGVAATFIYRR